MFTRIILAALLGFLCLAWTVSADEAKPLDRADEELIPQATEVYQGLLKSLREQEDISPSDIEALSTWSRRLIMLHLSRVGYWESTTGVKVVPNAKELHDTFERSVKEHSGRMREVEKIVRARVAAGVATKTVGLAAQFFRLEAEAMQRRIERTKAQLRRIAIDLPAVEKSPDKPKPDLVIDVHANGDMFVEKKKTSLNELKKRLLRLGKGKPEAIVLIRADADTKTAVVFKVIDLAGRANVGTRLAVREPDE